MPHKFSKGLISKRVLIALAVFFLFLLLHVAPYAAAAENIEYFYDDARQLIKVLYDDGTQVEYLYDGSGNRIAKTKTLPGAPVNNPPSQPVNISPADSAANFGGVVELTWSASDPDMGDNTFYDIYFGTVSPPPLHISGHSSTSCTTTLLDSNSTYYWKIVARDNHDAFTEGPISSFSTGSDWDLDGVSDLSDNCPTVPNPGQDDNDSDGLGDLCDSDDDGDGTPDETDNCALSDNFDQLDTDLDGIGNVCDSDDDADTVDDQMDNCPLISNSGQIDGDEDGFGDDCDNCPGVFNPGQIDSDNDGLGDECDPDEDGDGFDNTSDNCPMTPNPDQADSDADGFGDSCDNCPNVNNVDQLDINGDGVGEICTAYHCVVSSTDFQQALTIAESNNKYDIIMLQQGSYSVSLNNSSAFTYIGQSDPTEIYGLHIEGGYSSDCNSSVLNPDNTILSGQYSYRVLNIENTSPYTTPVSAITIQGLTIKNGSSTDQSYGGGARIYVQSGDINILDNIFNNNTTSDNCTVYWCNGGGIGATTIEGNITLKRNTITNNDAAHWVSEGGGAYLRIHNDGSVIVENNKITDNVTINGGGGVKIELPDTSTCFVSNNVILHNRTFNILPCYGGGIYIDGGNKSVVTNNVFSRNNQAYDGGYGGAIAIYSINIDLINNTITGNNAEIGGGIYLYTWLEGDINIFNNIIWGNSASEEGADIYLNTSSGSVINVHNNDFIATNVYGGPFTRESNNLDIEPLFVNFSSSDFHLSDSSPLINLGNNYAPGLPEKDFEGDSRITANKVDIGADEYSPISISFTSEPTVGAEPLSVDFTDSSTSTAGVIIEWAWDFENDGIVDSIMPNPTYDYTAVGFYSVSLTVTDSSGFTETLIKEDYIEVGVDTDGDGIIDIHDNCPSDFNQGQVDLDRDGIGYVCDSDIDLLDESMHILTLSSAVAPDSSASNGSYDVTNLMKDGLLETSLSVQKSKGKYDILSFQSSMDATELSSLTLSIYVNDFYRGETQDAVLYAYDANGDSVQSSPSQNVTLTTGWNDLDLTPMLYLMDGFGFVKFRISVVRNYFNVFESEFIALPAGGNQPPVANANGPYTGIVDIPVSFISSGSYDSNSDPITFFWDFGDSNTSIEENPFHAYTFDDIFNVTLTVTDIYDDSDTDTTTAIITSGGTNQPPVADAGPDVNAQVRENITFDGINSYDPDGSIITYEWDFGDGKTDSGSEVVHKYKKPGTYTVILTVTDDLGAQDQDTAISTITK